MQLKIYKRLHFSSCHFASSSSASLSLLELLFFLGVFFCSSHVQFYRSPMFYVSLYINIYYMAYTRFHILDIQWNENKGDKKEIMISILYWFYLNKLSHRFRWIIENLKRRQKRAVHATTSRYSTGLHPFCIRFIYSTREHHFLLRRVKLRAMKSECDRMRERERRRRSEME